MATRTATPLLRSPAPEIERIPWEELGPTFIATWGRPNDVEMPEDLTIYGKKGGGKSYFAGYVLRLRAQVRRSHVVVVCTKPTDSTISALGWPTVRRWPPDYGQDQVIWWARAKGISAEHLVPQRARVKLLMDALWQPGANRLVYWDELTYLEQDLRLKRELATFYREGRTQGITNIASLQRPAGVSRLAHSEAGWTVVFPPKDEDDRDRVAQILGSKARYKLVLDSLDKSKHEFLIVRDLTGERFISHLPAPPRRNRAKPAAPAGYGVPSRQRGDR